MDLAPSRWWMVATLVGALAACSSTVTGSDGEDDPPADQVDGGAGDGDGDGDGDDPDGDDGDTTLGPSSDPAAPTLTVTAPTRGTIVEGSSVVVAGRVERGDANLGAVRVNDRAVTLAADGSFEHTLPLEDGLTLIETTASDVNGLQASDGRAVLSGTMASSTSSVSNGVTAHLGPRTISRFSKMISDYANAQNMTVLARLLNPLVSAGSGCNSAQIYIDSLTRSTVAVGAAAVTGGIDTGGQVRDIVARGRVTFRALCFSGSADWTIRSSAYGVRGLVRTAVTGGTISVSLANVQSGFGSFQLSVNGVPSFVTDLLNGPVRDVLARILRDKIAEIIPKEGNILLRDFMVRSVSTDVLGTRVTASFAPTSITWSNVGGSVAIRTSIDVVGISGAPYLSTPRPRPSSSTMVSNDLRVAVADDAINQALAAAWSGGALDISTLDHALDQYGIESDVGSARVYLALPPVASFDIATGGARLSIGDLMIEAKDAAGETIASMAVSAQVDLLVRTTSTGRMRIVAASPRVIMQQIVGGASETTSLGPEDAEALAELATGELAKVTDQLMGAIAIPGLPGVTMTQLGLAPVDGYLVMGGSLTF